MIRLTQEFGAHAGRQLRFDRAPVRVGRATDCEVALDPSVDLDASAHHVELALDQGRWCVVDQNSRNGTWVNGQRVTRHPLAHGDVFECGRGGPRFRVELSPDAQRAAAPVSGVSTVAMPVMSSYGSGPVGAMPAAFATGPTPAPIAQPPQAPPPAVYAPPPATPGESVASSLPQGAQVGRQTLVRMIDDAVLRARKPERHTGLKVAVVMLSLLTAAALTVTGFVLWSRDDDRPRRPEDDPSTAGTRIARANEAAIYLMALVRPGRPNPSGFCTGFAVTDDLIATNAHCVDAARTEMAAGAQLVVLRNKSPGQRIAATPVYLDARYHDPRYSRGGVGYDVGLVRTGERLPSRVTLATDAELFAMHEGDGLFVYGFPGMTMNEASPVALITLGLLNRLTDFNDGVSTPALAQKLQHSAQTASGSSGSPIFLPTGHVIGLNAGSLADDERQTVSDPSNGQRREVEVSHGSNFKYGMRADLIRQAVASVGEPPP